MFGFPVQLATVYSSFMFTDDHCSLFSVAATNIFSNQRERTKTKTRFGSEWNRGYDTIDVSRL